MTIRGNNYNDRETVQASNKAWITSTNTPAARKLAV